MTPNDIEVLIHCHTVPSVHPRITAPAVREALKTFVIENMIYKVKGHEYYTTTLRGRVHISQLCNLEFPQQAWVGSDGKIIET